MCPRISDEPRNESKNMDSAMQTPGGGDPRQYEYMQHQRARMLERDAFTDFIQSQVKSGNLRTVGGIFFDKAFNAIMSHDEGLMEKWKVCYHNSDGGKSLKVGDAPTYGLPSTFINNATPPLTWFCVRGYSDGSFNLSGSTIDLSGDSMHQPGYDSDEMLLRSFVDRCQ